MSDMSAAPRAPDAETLRTLCDALSRAGYREETVCGLAGCRAWHELGHLGAAALRHRVMRFPPPLADLGRLFLLGLDVPEPRVRSTLGGDAVDALVRSGVTNRREDALRAAVSLTPSGGFLFASDRFERHRARAADFVLGPGGVTRRLADLTIRTPVDAALDLGSGAGVLAVLAAGHAARVVATDVNPRAVAFGRFNVTLNGLDNVELRQGNLFEPVEGERFDLVSCNPPYVISPVQTFTYRDGGSELCRQIVGRAPDHLTESGLFQMLAEWPRRPEDDWSTAVASWLDGVKCDAWVLRTHEDDPIRYAARWLSQEYPGDDVPQEAFDRWVSYLGDLGVTAVVGGLIVMRRPRGPVPLRVFRNASRIVPPAAASLRRWMAAQDLLQGIADDTELLDVRLSASPDLERHRRDQPTGEGWSLNPDEMRHRAGVLFGARVDPMTSELVGLLDGQRTPRQAMSLLAERIGVPAEPFLGGLPAALRRLLRLGLLVPAEEGDRPERSARV